MIAPALAPATLTHFLIGFVGCSSKPRSAPARPRPLTPPPRKTPSASSIHSIATSSLVEGQHRPQRLNVQRQTERNKHFFQSEGVSSCGVVTGVGRRGRGADGGDRR